MKRLKPFISMLLALTTALSMALPAAAADGPKKFRAVWVSTIYNLDYPSEVGLSISQMKSEARQILDKCKSMGMTAVILQVRPNGDAFYKSSLYPWSQYLTGSQGIAPSGGFDPLKYWVTEAHARGLELHAWINPYRVTRSGTADYNSLASSNPAVKHPDWVVKYSDGNYYLNPGIPEVRKLVVDGVTEIVRNYDVDGIHMDDYFYPGTGFSDDAAYKKYGSAFQSIDDWRRDNVNQLVKAIHAAIRKVDSTVSFGVSPFGIWANKSAFMPQGSDTSGNQTYFSHYADTRKWVKEGWIDYICPQIYWEIGHNKADYETLANWWAGTVRGTGVKLYIGMADYKAGNSSKSSPWHGITAIENQIALNATIPEITGEVHFRYQFLLSVSGLEEFYTAAYNGKIIPDAPVVPPASETGVKNRYTSSDKTGDWVEYENGDWKFLLAGGAAASSWQKIDGAWYYFNPEGNQMITGWRQIDGKWYYFRSWGGMATSWYREGNTWYYLTGTGAISQRWYQLGGKWYYFYQNGVMACSATTPDGCRVDASGVWIR